MADMRVQQLAKELGLSSQDLLAKLGEMGIAAKSHASMLSSEQVSQVRKAYSAGGQDEVVDEEMLRKAAQEAEEQAARRAAMEAERRAREAERAARGDIRPKAAAPAAQATVTSSAPAAPSVSVAAPVSAQTEASSPAVSAPEEQPAVEESAAVAAVVAPAAASVQTPAVSPTIAVPQDARAETSRPAQQTRPQQTRQNAQTATRPQQKRQNASQQEKPAARPASTSKSAYSGLASQIATQQEQARRAKAQAEAQAKAERMRREVAKKQAVEESLRQRSRKTTKAEPEAAASPKPAPRVVPTTTSSTKYSSLLEQIAAEQQRIAQQKEEQAQAKRAGSKDARSQTPARPQARGKKAGHVFQPEVPELQERAAQAEAQDNRRAQDQGTGFKSGRGRQNNSQQRRSERREGNDDRYAQMAVLAEKVQRDKVLAEARAAVSAAESEAGEGRRRKRKEKREAEAREQAEQKAIERGLDPSLVLDSSVVEIPQGATVAKFSELVGVQPNDVIKRLFLLGQPLTLTQSMSDDMIELIADDLGRKVRVVSPEEEFAVVYHDTEDQLKPRPPVVTVMGHVDHGKTSLLDAIRHTGVAAGEAGGITQHIGASVVDINGRQITFIDTPGHEAFTAMRARGAQVTDVIVLVVAADDGVMPQTIEAINHARAANVPIVVAINKIDKPGANPDKVRQELVEYGVVSEEWGGQNMFVEVSAKKHLHIDDLLETILLQADVLELKANPDALASGFVIEANLDKGRGPVATVLVQRGTLHPGDTVVAGTSYGRVRALINPHGDHVQAAKPSDPVEILGLSSVPTAGDEFRVFEDERDARKLAEERALRARLAEQETKSHMSLDDLFNRIEEGKQTDLNLIVKADVQGSIEALNEAFAKMDQSEVRINIVHSAVGGITETDVTLAAASDAIIIGFNVRPMGKAKQQAEHEKVDIRLYRVIYQAIEDINAARVGLLKPEIVEEDTGTAQVREVFRVPKVGAVAGCYVTEGEIARDNKVRLVREGTVIFEGTIASLKRFKDDVKSVRQGYECGISLNGFQDIKIGDSIEGYRVREIERTE